MLNRRNLIRSALFGMPVLLFGSISDPFRVVVHKVSGVKNKLLTQLFFKYHQDKIDKNPHYLKDHDFTAWHNEIHPILRQLARLNVPAGPIVELGVHKGLSSKVLKDVFGIRRYIGIDVSPMTDDPQVIRQDIRSADNLPEKAGFIWNDISTWEGSPRSRLAAYKWARRNLKPGGIYIDEGRHKIPADLNLRGFDLIQAGRNFTVFRKNA